MFKSGEKRSCVRARQCHRIPFEKPISLICCCCCRCPCCSCYIDNNSNNSNHNNAHKQKHTSYSRPKTHSELQFQLLYLAFSSLCRSLRHILLRMLSPFSSTNKMSLLRSIFHLIRRLYALCCLSVSRYYYYFLWSMNGY